MLLNALNPGRGLGLDISSAMVEIARKKYSHLEFRVEDLEDVTTDEKFDYVVLSDVIGFLNDVQATLKRLQQGAYATLAPVQRRSPRPWARVNLT